MTIVSLRDLLGQVSIGLDAVEAGLLGATPYHCKRAAVVSLAIGRALGYEDARLLTLAGCALLHDNALTQYILSERPYPGRSQNLVSHCVLGERNGSVLPFPTASKGIIQYHHEWADGGGVFGLREGEYPEEAGIIALADQVDVKFRLQTLSKGQLSEVRGFLRRSVGTRYSPHIAEAALTVLNEALLEKLEDNAIHGTLRREMPEMELTLDAGRLIALAGVVGEIVDYKSKFTREHTVQIANKAWLMGGLYGYNKEEQAEFYQAAALHDVGKLMIPTAILEKPGALTDEEFAIIKTHGRYTWEMLEPIRGFEQIALWAANHHEKLDGSGYPFGKAAAQLDFNSRLLACLDIYQAVREARPYHESRSHGEAMKILYSMASGGSIDGEICADLDRYLKELENGNAPVPLVS